MRLPILRQPPFFSGRTPFKVLTIPSQNSIQENMNLWNKVVN
jgi:hypothetical protein